MEVERSPSNRAPILEWLPPRRSRIRHARMNTTRDATNVTIVRPSCRFPDICRIATGAYNYSKPDDNSLNPTFPTPRYSADQIQFRRGPIKDQQASFDALSRRRRGRGRRILKCSMGGEPRPTVLHRIVTLDEQHLVRFHRRKVEPAMPGAEPDHVNLVLQIGRDQIILSNAS